MAYKTEEFDLVDLQAYAIALDLAAHALART